MNNQSDFQIVGQCYKSYHISHGKKDSKTSIDLRLFYHSDAPTKCWNCEFPLKSDLFCSKCQKLQIMPKKLTFFDIIGIEKDFDINKSELQRKYRGMQYKLHPDRFNNKSTQEKKISERLSALINKAYYTLLNPLERGMYLLKLEGESIPEDTKNTDPEFLMEIMRINEEIEEATHDKERVIRLFRENRKIIIDLTEQVSRAFKNHDVDGAKRLLLKMKFHTSMDNKLRSIKQNLGIVD